MTFRVSFRNIGPPVGKSNYKKHMERKTRFKPMLHEYKPSDSASPCSMLFPYEISPAYTNIFVLNYT
jgi:hypothetical protein